MRTILAALALGSSLAVNAAEPDEGNNWYRVELLVFSYGRALQQEAEQWPLLPPLTYPGQVQRLKVEAPLENAEIPLRLTTIEQSAPHPLIELDWERSLQELYREQQESVPTEEESLPAKEESMAAQQVETPGELTVLRPFARLGDSSYEFNRRRLERGAGGRRVLYHASWYQPLRSREDSPPLLVEGEPQQGDYPTLQGSIRLYVSRYLHLETDLWLNTAGDYLPANWKMPRPPLAPEPFIADDHFFRVELPADWLSEAAPLAVSEFYQLMPEPEYPFRHAVLLQQKRRMRSGELHYIDHPLMGLLIKVTPYEFEPFFEAAEQVSQR